MHKILVVGDVIVDEYIYGIPHKISAEAPIPVLKYKNKEVRPGGAANVALNILFLGCQPFLIGVTGEEFPWWEDFNTMQACLCLVTDKSRPTTIKQRIIANKQQIVRIDNEFTSVISKQIEDQIVDHIVYAMTSCQAAVISDYDKGVVTDRVCNAIMGRASQLKIPVIVDPKKLNFLDYRGATIITPNMYEYNASLDIFGEIPKTFPAILVTMGEHGMALHQNGNVSHIPTIAKEVVDVTGAGDTVVAALAVFLARHPGASFYEAAEFANTAAAVVVSKHGTATVTMDEIDKYEMALPSVSKNQ